MAFGKKLAEELREGDLVLLSGQLGAGKTTLVKGVIQALTGADPTQIQSPTFTYVHPYKGNPPLFHFDLYRLDDEKVFFDLDLDAYLSAGGISLVEWPEKVPSLAKREGRIFEIHIAYDPQGRLIDIKVRP